MGVKILAIETSCDDTGIAVLEVHPVKSDLKSKSVSLLTGQFDRVNQKQQQTKKQNILKIFRKKDS